MRTRLLPLLIVLMAGVLLALGFPLADRIAGQEQQRVIVDRIDDTARFASLAQYVASRNEARPPAEDERLRALQEELHRYHDLYGIRAGVYYRDRSAMAAAPAGWRAMARAEGDRAFSESLAGRRSHDPPQVWPWQDDRLTVASPVVRDGDVVAVVVTDSPTGAMRSRTLTGWLWLGAGITAAMTVAVAAAYRLTGWVLRPVRVLDKAAHDIATGRLKSRVAAAGGPPELRRLAGSFNEMADNVEMVLEQQRTFVADASHQLRNPLSALLLRIELLRLEAPQAAAEIESVQAEGTRLARVLDDLLDLALAEHSPADLRVTDVARLAAERVASWRPLAEGQDVRLFLSGAPAVTGWADEVALSSALDAVVDNAVKFSPRCGEVEVRVDTAGDEVTVAVADGGPGLTDEELGRIGDRFWRSGRHQNVSGSGLGLSIARALLTAGGGRISYERNEPEGLRVTIAVPRTAPEDGVQGGG
ncbi:HAMP domain-containing histidine kinase [Streptomyces sp. NBC_01808]|uniref:HAMP domain-containing sensor histidine kinase n=1 Tax=Streptomyces sp. NBC_01808 TaxID=2975947 RepID=UPI002DDC8478|nr:HAMP domain-containing sensor histidine kinase [Streptomyces sp. NBC_01808]WSA41027.1 HAMP domain-containing histidine kinase [Streptomyces sp. NBC_01808]